MDRRVHQNRNIYSFHRNKSKSPRVLNFILGLKHIKTNKKINFILNDYIQLKNIKFKIGNEQTFNMQYKLVLAISRIVL